jgi:hypothetical protein
MTIPDIDPKLVAALAGLASQLDGGARSSDQDLVDRFNALAGTTLTFADFQGIYGAEEHETFVERVLTERATAADPTLDRAGLIALISSVLADPTNDRQLAYAEAVVRKTFGVTDFTNAIFWPDAFFGHDDPTRDHPPEEIADAILLRAQG